MPQNTILVILFYIFGFIKIFLGAVQFGSSSKTAKNPGYSQKSADILMAGPLRYEMELYNLCQKIFYERLKYYKVNIARLNLILTVILDRIGRGSCFRQDETFGIYSATRSLERLISVITNILKKYRLNATDFLCK